MSIVPDPQDPLPESNWFWRRLLAFGMVIFFAWQLHLSGNRMARAADANHAADVLLSYSKWIIVAWLVTTMLYMIAPSGEQVVKMLATLSAWKSGISTAISSHVDAKHGVAETKTVAGPAAGADPTEDLPEYAR